MIQSATVRQRFLRPSVRPMAAMVSGGQRQPLPRHGLPLLEHGDRTACQRRQARSHAAKLAGARHRALDATDRAEVAFDPFAHHGIGNLPDVEPGIKAARNPFNHHHGLLQQDQFGPGPHVEQAGDLEQQGQQLRHRNFFSRSVMDRFADRPDGLREIVDRMMRRHIAGFEMHLGDASIIAGDETEKDFGEEAALLHAEAPHDAEVNGDEPALIVEEQIARMHVGVEEAVAQRMAQKALDHLASESRQIELAIAPAARGRRAQCRRSTPWSGRYGWCDPSRPSARGSPDRRGCSPPSPTSPPLQAADPSPSRPSATSC